MNRKKRRAAALILSAALMFPSVYVPGTKLNTYTANSAETETADGMVFSKRVGLGFSDQLVLTEYTGSASDVVIPETVDGKTVTGIGDRVFAENASVSTVTIPDTVNYFGGEVFRDSSVKSVNIPKKLKIIPSYSFYNCQDLTDVAFHDGIAAIANTAFKKTGVTIPEQLRSRVTGDELADSDDFCTFTNGDFVYDVFVMDGDVWVEYTGYKGTGGDIVIPDSSYADVISCQQDIFQNTKNIRSVVFPEKMLLLTIRFANTAIEEVVLPENFDITDSMFENCTELSSVTFRGESVSIIIGEKAFRNCTSLKNLDIPETCQQLTIGSRAFEGSGLTKFSTNAAAEVGAWAFSGCSSLTEAGFGAADMKSRAIYECGSLKELDFGGKTVLADVSIYSCDALENINFNGSEVVSDNSIRNCISLMNIDGAPAFDSATGDFAADKKEFILSHFNGADEVGFVNEYVKAQVEKVVKENVRDGMTDVEKLRIIHDWVCNNTDYTEGSVQDRQYHNDASLFMNDFTVCEGYARACNLLYHAAGLETCYVHNGEHAWNVVKAGGQYFHIDTTWDDQGAPVHDWFLKSDAEMQEAGGAHAQWELYTPSSLHSFQASVLPECSYSMGDVNTDGGVNIADLVTMQRYLLGNADISPDKRVLADVYSDGSCDGFDIGLLRKKLIAKGDL